MKISETIRPFIHLLFPPVCRACGKLLSGDPSAILCARCASQDVSLKLPVCDLCGLPVPAPADPCSFPSSSHGCIPFKPAFDCIRSAVAYENPVRELIHQFKFQGSRRVRPYLQSLFADGADRLLGNFHLDAIVPVPLHWTRHFSREFNQADVLAQSLSGHSGIPVLADAVRRCKRTYPQSRLGGKWRGRGLEAAFCPGTDAVSGLDLLLVDDVMTTGQTISACAAALRQAGAHHIVGYTLARRI